MGIGLTKTKLKRKENKMLKMGLASTRRSILG